MYDAGVALNGLSCFITRTSLNHLLYIFQDLSSQNMYDAGVALNGLSCFITRTSLNHLLYFSGLE